MITPEDYQSKPESIKAILFTGGEESATPIVDWVLAEGKTARWHEERWFDTVLRSDGIALNSSRQIPVPEHITIDERVSLFVYSGQMVCLSEGVFFVCDLAEFVEVYERKVAL